MILTDELKIFNDKIEANQAQYKLKFLHYHLKKWTKINI